MTQIIAEIGGSHGRDLTRAYKLIEQARILGANLVKFQTLDPEYIAADAVISNGPWAGQSYRDLYKETQLPWEWHKDLFGYARSIGLIPFSTPFCEHSVDFLESLDCPIYKVASAEITHIPLIQHIAKTGKPVIISTGMATLWEIDDAVFAFRRLSNAEITLMICVSQYPAMPEDYRMDLFRTFTNMRGYSVGVSDHTQTAHVPIIAATKGAKYLERHLTLTTHLPDDLFASNPDQFADAVYAVRSTEDMFRVKEPRDRGFIEYRRCAWVVAPIKAGEPFTSNNLRALRPWCHGGVSPDDMVWLQQHGKCATRDLEPNTPLMQSDYET